MASGDSYARTTWKIATGLIYLFLTSKKIYSKNFFAILIKKGVNNRLPFFDIIRWPIHLPTNQHSQFDPED